MEWWHLVRSVSLARVHTSQPASLGVRWAVSIAAQRTNPEPCLVSDPRCTVMSDPRCLEVKRG